MFRKRIYLLLVMIMSFSMIFTGCGSGTDNGGENGQVADEVSICYVAHYIDPCPIWDPAESAGVENQVLLQIYETLLRFDSETNTFEGVLATDYSKNDDGTIWTFNLRDDVTFQDGTPFNADAVKFSYERTIAVGKGCAYLWTDLKEINVIDDYTIELVFNNPAPADLLVSCAYAACIYSPTAFTNDYDAGSVWANAGNACGTGPYMLQSQIPGNQVILQKYANYWGGWKGSEFDRIVFQLVSEDATRRQLLESGEADVVTRLMPDHIEDLEKKENINIIYFETHANQLMFLNTVKPPLDNKLVRQALAYAFPYENVIDYVKLGHGYVAKDIIPQSLWGANQGEPYYHYDLDKAKELLTEAGYPDGGFSLEYTYTAGNEDRKKTAELFMAELSKLGITLNIRGMQWDNMMAKVKADNISDRQDITTWMQYSSMLSPATWYEQNVLTEKSGIAWNHSYYSNPELDSLIKEAYLLTGIDIDQAADLYREIGKRVAEDCPMIYMGDEQGIVFTQNSFKGFVPNPAYKDVIFFYDCYREK